MALPCFFDDETRAAMRINKDINRELERWKKDQSREYKLLLLGTGEAGKSTFIKQMRIIHGKGYTDKDRAEFAGLVYRNIILAAQLLAEAMLSLKIQYETEDNKSFGNEFLEFEPGNIEHMSDVNEDTQEKISKFWRDSGVQSCFERRREFQISDSAKYYMDDLERIFNSSYAPTLQDVLRVRIATTGIIEYPFNMKKDVIFRMIDVGGQRSERRKWIHAFEGVKAVIFLTAINEYDQVLFEDAEQNRMHESLALFETILRYPWFQEASSILFLNKYDLFEDKISKSHLADHFPQYNGPKCQPAEAAEFIKSMFLSVNENEDKRIFPHFTTATDTENIERVFEAVKIKVLEDNLRDYNLIV